MSVPDEKTIRWEYIDLLRRSGFPVTDAERESLEISDFGLSNLRSEGFAFIDILRSERLRITLIALLPNQTLPQHVHPPYEGEQGKEETIRALSGHTKVYIKGKANAPDMLVPAGKDPFYTARQEICLDSGEQYTVSPGIEHWFQGGPEGSVNMCFQNRVDETKNRFWDPQSFGCPIGLDDR
jgi:D-lyxose ketol-isomerase